MEKAIHILSSASLQRRHTFIPKNSLLLRVLRGSVSSLYIKNAVITKSSASVTIDENTTVRVVA